MAKVDNNNGFELAVVSNDEKYKLRARRIMKKDGCAYDRNGKVIAGAPWSFCGWDVTLWSIDGRQKYSWTTSKGQRANVIHFKTKKDVLAALPTIFKGNFSEAASELTKKK